jgi:hypothetical protein
VDLHGHLVPEASGRARDAPAIGAIYFGSRRLRSKIELINVSHTAALMPVADAEAA